MDLRTLNERLLGLYRGPGYLARRRLEKLQTWIVWKLPRWLIKWAFFRVIAHATSGQYGNTDVVNLTWGDAADRWESQ